MLFKSVGTIFDPVGDQAVNIAKVLQDILNQRQSISLSRGGVQAGAEGHPRHTTQGAIDTPGLIFRSNVGGKEWVK
jgi:hypothetical protein